MNETLKATLDALRRGENPELAKGWSDAYILLRVDVKTFFLFTQVFLDTLARAIRESYGRSGRQLPYSMTDLLTNAAAQDIDAPFFSRLRNEMAWYSDFNDKRDDIAHWLGSPRFTTTRSGDYGFDLLKFARASEENVVL
jgi:hypothetical protein